MLQLWRPQDRTSTRTINLGGVGGILFFVAPTLFGEMPRLPLARLRTPSPMFDARACKWELRLAPAFCTAPQGSTLFLYHEYFFTHLYLQTTLLPHTARLLSVSLVATPPLPGVEPRTAPARLRCVATTPMRTPATGRPCPHASAKTY